MNKINRVILKVVFVAVCAVSVLNVIDYIYAATATNAITSNITMAATIEPSMTLSLSDASKTLNVIPSSGGNFGSTSVTVGAYSNGHIGYSLTMATTSTSLTGASTGATIPTLASDSTCNGGSACTSSNFSAGRWGIAVGTAVYGPASTSSSPLVTVSSSTATVSSNTKTINLGVNLDLSVPVDEYSTTLNFALTSAVIPTYNITFNYDTNITALALKDSSGTTVAPASSSTGTAVYSLSYANTYTIVPTFASGYGLGTITRTSGAGFLNSGAMTYTAGSGTATITLTSVSTVTAIYMQDVSSWIGSLSAGDEIIVTDNRDGKDYYAMKLSNGHMLMTQNLDHDIVAQANYYTPQNTDIPSAWTPSTATTTTTTWSTASTYYNLPQSYDPGDKYWNGTLDTDWGMDGTLDSTKYISATGDAHYHVGNFYDWTAAVAMNDSSSHTADGTDVGQSICPAGWTLPTKTSGTDKISWNDIYTAYSSATWYDSPLYFTFAGYWDGSSDTVGLYGYWWSREVESSSLAYYLGADVDGSVYPSVSSDRYYGPSVRCISR